MIRNIKLLAAGALLFAVGLTVGVVFQDGAGAKAGAPPAPRGYMVVMGKDYDREALRAYSAVLPAIYEKYEGQYLGLTAMPVILEGAYGYDSILISEWPSLQAAKDFWASPEYREAVKLREGNGTFDVIAFEGFPQPGTVLPLARGE